MQNTDDIDAGMWDGMPADLTDMDDFSDAEEVNLTMDMCHGILALKQLNEAMEYVTENGYKHDWDIDTRDDMISMILDEIEATSSVVTEAYHYNKVGFSDDTLVD